MPKPRTTKLQALLDSLRAAPYVHRAIVKLKKAIDQSGAMTMQGTSTTHVHESGASTMQTTTHTADLPYEQEELRALFDLASREDVDVGGRYDRRGGAITSGQAPNLSGTAPSGQCTGATDALSVWWRMPSSRDPVPAHRHRHKMVQMQRDHRGTARRRPPQDHHPVLTPLKMSPPPLAPGMEQADTPPGQGIAPMRLLALKQIARPTGQPEVVLGIRATARPGNDMINFQWPGHIRLGRATIPTPMRRGTADARTQGGREGGRH